MILKSAFPPPAHGPSHLGSLRGWAFFQCTCGADFYLKESNSFLGWEKVKCNECKRVERIQDRVGERYVMKRIKSDAARAGRVFELDLDWISKVIHDPCHYCGRTDGNTINVKSKVDGQFLIKGFRYNGIDRVNNDIGYTIENSVPCCFVCNRAKQTMGYEEFLLWIENMIQYRRDNI